MYQALYHSLKITSISDEDEEENANDGSQKIVKSTASLIEVCDDPDVKADAKLMDELQAVIEKNPTSILFTPFITQIKSVQAKARRSLRKRIEYKLASQKSNNLLEDNDMDQVENEEGKYYFPHFVHTCPLDNQRASFLFLY